MKWALPCVSTAASAVRAPLGIQEVGIGLVAEELEDHLLAQALVGVSQEDIARLSFCDSAQHHEPLPSFAWTLGLPGNRFE